MGQSWSGIVAQLIEAAFSYLFGKILNGKSQLNSLVVCMIVQGTIAISMTTVLLLRVWIKEEKLEENLRAK
jgi:hypothetical protein